MERERLEYPNPINWENLSTGIDYYKTRAFKYIEVPWFIPTEIMHITYDGPYRFKTPLGDMIGSAEQSFLHLQFNQGLAPGRYMTITPCFRDEPETEFNFKQFIKLELYITDDVSEKRLQKAINTCQWFMYNMLCDEGVYVNPEIKDMGDGTFDIECEGIELGSYGIREHEGHKWIYATGIAEPRLSQVTEIVVNKK